MHFKDFAPFFSLVARDRLFCFRYEISLSVLLDRFPPLLHATSNVFCAFLFREEGDSNNKPARFSLSVFITNSRESIEKMTQFRFQISLIFNALIVLVIHSNARCAAAQNKDELFTVNITMKDFQTSTVCTALWHLPSVSTHHVGLYLTGRSVCVHSIWVTRWGTDDRWVFTSHNASFVSSYRSRFPQCSRIFAIDQHEFSSSHAHLCLWISRLVRTILVRCQTFLSVSFFTIVVCLGLRARHVAVVNRWSFMAGGEMRHRWYFLKVNPLISSCRWSSTKRSSSRHVDVGFAVGRNTPYKHIVVNIHYFSILKNDNSGNQLTLSRKPYADSFVHCLRTISILCDCSSDGKTMQVWC